jgi:hypothetical protein
MMANLARMAPIAAIAAIALPAHAQQQGKIPPPPKLPGMVRWSDPSEHAFTVNVPSGWRITGGTHRNSPIDARNYVSAESPDGKIRVWVDAPDILPRQEPHPAYYRLGWYEGKVVKSQAGPLAIEKFKSGSQFAQQYTAQKLCRNPQTLSAFDMRNETQQINRDIAPAAARARVQARASAGDYTYRCGQDTTGALMEMSNRITKASIEQAKRSLDQNTKLVQERQKQFDQMNQSMMSSFHRQQESQDRIRQRWSDITLGQIHGCDDLGNCTTVSNDYKHYWTKDGRTVVGGPSDGSPPGPQYHQWKPDY